MSKICAALNHSQKSLLQWIVVTVRLITVQSAQNKWHQYSGIDKTSKSSPHPEQVGAGSI